MSTRRFVAYFLAISAGSTVAFASTLIGRPMPPELMAEQSETPASRAAISAALDAIRHRRHHKHPAKIAEVAMLK